jgi:HEAT repeat protein
MSGRLLCGPLFLAAWLLVCGCGRSAHEPPAGHATPLATNAAALTAALRQRAPEVRAEAARLIAENNIEVAPSVLVDGLNDPNPNVRRFCAMALGRKRVAAAVRPLFELLRDDDWRVRAEAATALGRIGDARAAAWLVQLLGDNDAYVRFCAASALRDLVRESNRGLLRRAYARAGPVARPSLAIALGQLAEPAVLDVLIGVTQTNDAVLRRYAIEALGCYPAEAVTNALAALLQSEDPDVRAEAVRAWNRARAGGAPCR